jgi:biopolymer transport protein TolR
MPRRTSIVALEQIREINMTPLIDLTFLLLITFIITFPLIEQGVPVNLPRGKAQDISSQHHRTISVNLQGEIFLDERSISRDDLASEMNALGVADPEAVVLVRADENIAYGKVAEVVRILHDAKIARMALVTRAE